MPDGTDSRDMSLPELLAEHVGDESVVAGVPLGGDDHLVVTPTRTLVYRGDGLLSDESVTAHSHDVERIAISTGRRKTKLTLGYGLDDDETISVPTKHADNTLHPILAGVLSARGVTQPGESVLRTFRFSELTLVVTTDRLVKHVGGAVWDDEFEEFPYTDLTDLDFEEGTVATAVVLTHAGRSERFKAPNESARAVRETLVDAVCDFYDVDSLEEFRVTVAADADDSDTAADAGGTTDFGEGPDPLSASPVADAEAEAGTNGGTGAEPTPKTQTSGSVAAADPASEPTVEATANADRTTNSATDPSTTGMGSTEPSTGDVATGSLTDDGSVTDSEPGAPTSDPAGDAVSDLARNDAADPVGADSFNGSSFETAGVEDADLATEVAALRRTVETQSERLDRQSALIEQLIEELRQGR